MADLIRILEADLFGGHEWAAELYPDLAEVPEAPDRLAVQRGLLRSLEALEGRAEEAMRAAEGLVAAEEQLDERERAVLEPLASPREALFERADGASARAFLAAFEEAWARGPKSALVPDAILAALARSNLLASLERKSLAPDEARGLHARAAALYEEVNAMLQFRVGSGEPLWSETAQSALFRAAAAWRLAGDEARSKRAREVAGEPRGAPR